MCCSVVRLQAGAASFWGLVVVVFCCYYHHDYNNYYMKITKVLLRRPPAGGRCPFGGGWGGWGGWGFVGYFGCWFFLRERAAPLSDCRLEFIMILITYQGAAPSSSCRY